MPIDFYATGYLERYTRQSSHGYKRVMDGTLKELIEYACAHNRGLIDIYRITVGTDTYTGEVIRDLFHSLSFPKSSNRTGSPHSSVVTVKAGHYEVVQSGYNARVDRLNAIRLLKALVAAGANARAPRASDWVHKMALRDMSLQGTDLASAIAYAEGEGWLADLPTRKGWIFLTRTGEVVAQANDSNSVRKTRYRISHR